MGFDRLIAGLQDGPVVAGRPAGQRVGPAAAPVAVPFLVADLEAVGIAVPTAAVVAGREDGGEGAHFSRPWKEVNAVAILGFAEAGCVLDDDRNLDAVSVRLGHRLVERAEVVD